MKWRQPKEAKNSKSWNVHAPRRPYTVFLIRAISKKQKSCRLGCRDLLPFRPCWIGVVHDLRPSNNNNNQSKLQCIIGGCRAAIEFKHIQINLLTLLWLSFAIHPHRMANVMLCSHRVSDAHLPAAFISCKRNRRSRSVDDTRTLAHTTFGTKVSYGATIQIRLGAVHEIPHGRPFTHPDTSTQCKKLLVREY